MGGSSGPSSSTPARGRRGGWRRRGRDGVGPVAGCRARGAVPVNATVPAVAADRVAEVLARFPGCTTPRSRWPSADRRSPTTSTGSPRCATCWAVGAGCASTPTGRGRSTPLTRRSAHLAAYDLEYAEQPCATVEELRDLRIALARNGIDVPVAADESIRKAEDPLRVRDLEAADVVVVKVAPLGGCGPRWGRGRVRAPRGRVVGARHERRHLRGGRARGGAPRARPRLRAGHRRPPRGDVAARRSCPIRARWPRGSRRDPGLLDPRRRTADRVAWWATGSPRLPRPPARGTPDDRVRLAGSSSTPARRRRAVVALLGAGHRLGPVAQPGTTTSSPPCCRPRRPWVKLQAVADGPGGIHLDLDVEDVHAAAATAERLGATRTGAIGDTVVVLRSPGGLAFCLTPWRGDAEQVRDGVPDLVDQVCLDIPADRARRRGRLLARPHRMGVADLDEPSCRSCRRPAGIPLRCCSSGSMSGPAGAGPRRHRVRRPGGVRRATWRPGPTVVRSREQWTRHGRPRRPGLLPHRPQPDRAAG